MKTKKRNRRAQGEEAFVRYLRALSFIGAAGSAGVTRSRLAELLVLPDRTTNDLLASLQRLGLARRVDSGDVSPPYYVTIGRCRLGSFGPLIPAPVPLDEGVSTILGAISDVIDGASLRRMSGRPPRSRGKIGPRDDP
jgi:hypothetical protein